MGARDLYERPGLHFTRTEIWHLLGAVAMLSYAFSIVRSPIPDYPARLVPDPLVLVGATLAVSSGFVLHELAHKWMAIQFGHAAMFRAQFRNLFLSMALVLSPLGFFIAAPGAVEIYGNVTRPQSGRISAVGPGTNVVIAALCWPWTWNIDATAPHVVILDTVAFTNALLACFNLIPAGPLDGRKILRWNIPVWIGMTAVSVTLFLAILLQWRPL